MREEYEWAGEGSHRGIHPVLQKHHRRVRRRSPSPVFFSTFFGGSPDGARHPSAAHSARSNGRSALAQPLVIRTLLVDDSEDFLDGASLWIAGRPELLVVGKARSGLRALEYVARLKPDHVIMDCVLRELDGFRVARLIKARPDPPMVVGATFVTSGAARDEALAAGADGFIAKDEFAEGLDRLLDELIARTLRDRKDLTTPETPVRLGSQIEPDP